MISSVLVGSEQRGAVNHLSCLWLELRGVHRALTKAATMVVVRSCIGVVIDAERSSILKGGSYHAPS